MEHQSQKILIVDDDPIIRQYLREAIELLGHEVQTASGRDSFKDAYETFKPDVILLDLIMPETDGAELLKFLAASHCEIPVALMSGLDDRALRAAKRIGNSHGLRMLGGLEKPFNGTALKEMLSRTGAEKNELEAQNLLEAIDRGELRLYYQPQVCASDGRLVGAEALLRWQHPEYGMLLPGYFLELAKEPEMICSITRWVCTSALAQLGQWRRQGIEMTLSINLSSADTLAASFPCWLRDLAAENGVDPGQVILEVTEQDASTYSEQSKEVLTRLRLKGFQLAIDDFGTGYSSLAMLQRVPFGELKIDRCFIMDSAEDLESRKIVEVMVTLGQSLGLRTVAEGVEDEPTLELVRSLGIDMIQGYYTGRPMPADSFMRGFHRCASARQIG